MGHVRLGTLPRSKAWKEVVGLITAGADVAQIANATIRAADKAFSFVLNDAGFTEAVWLMTQLAIAGKKDTENFNRQLQAAGVNLPENTSLPDIAAAITDAMDKKLEANGSNSDLGEMSQRALVGALVEHISPKLPTLFTPEADDVKAALASLGKKREFLINVFCRVSRLCAYRSYYQLNFRTCLGGVT
jgi:transketolase